MATLATQVFNDDTMLNRRSAYAILCEMAAHILLLAKSSIYRLVHQSLSYLNSLSWKKNDVIRNNGMNEWKNRSFIRR